LPAGFVINKYGFRWLGFFSLVAVAMGDLLTALATDFSIALAGRFILGVGGAFLVVGTPIFIPQWFEHKNLGKAMGIYGTNMPVSIIAAFPVAATLSQYYGWRYSFYVGSLVAFVCALFFVFAVKEGPLKGEPKPIRMEEVKHAIKTVEVWKVGVVWMLFNTATIAFLSWAPRLFQQFKSLDSIQASLLATVVMYSAVCLVPVFGWASDRLDRRKPFHHRRIYLDDPDPDLDCSFKRRSSSRVCTGSRRVSRDRSAPDNGSNRSELASAAFRHWLQHHHALPKHRDHIVSTVRRIPATIHSVDSLYSRRHIIVRPCRRSDSADNENKMTPLRRSMSQKSI
jgi:MFS family permease